MKILYINNKKDKEFQTEKKVLSEIYSNNANTIKYLLYFFNKRSELIRFFKVFKGKTLIIPENFEDFMKFCLTSEDSIQDKNCTGISEDSIKFLKDKILQSYLNLYDNYEDCIKTECKQRVKNQETVRDKYKSCKKGVSTRQSIQHKS